MQYSSTLLLALMGLVLPATCAPTPQITIDIPDLGSLDNLYTINAFSSNTCGGLDVMNKESNSATTCQTFKNTMHSVEWNGDDYFCLKLYSDSSCGQQTGDLPKTSSTSQCVPNDQGYNSWQVVTC